jgi:membrane protein
MLTVLRQAFRDFGDDESPVRAAALAYYTVFALPPLLVLIIMIAGAVWDPQDVQRAMEGQFATLVGAEGGKAIHGMIQSADRPGSGGVLATLLSVGMLLFGATGAVIQLQSALNRAWEVRPDPKAGGIRSFIGKRLFSVAMILGVAFLLVVSLALSALISAVGDSMTFIPEPVLHAANVVVSFAVITVVFAAMFKVLPDAVIAWRHVWVGAVVTSLLFVAGKFLLGLYLGRSAPGDAFGAASALAVILVWIYYAGMIVLFGAEFTQAWAKHTGATVEPEKGAIRFDRETKPGGRDVAHAARHTTTPRRLQMENVGNRDLPRVRANGGNGRITTYPVQEQSIGELFRALTTDSSHLIRQEIALAKTELKESASNAGKAAAGLGTAVGVAIPGLLAITAFLVIGLGDLIDNYWLSALIVGAVFLVTAATMAKRAMARLTNGAIGIPETAGTLREDAQWAREEVQAFTREFTA